MITYITYLVYAILAFWAYRLLVYFFDRKEVRGKKSIR